MQPGIGSAGTALEEFISSLCAFESAELPLAAIDGLIQVKGGCALQGRARKSRKSASSHFEWLSDLLALNPLFCDQDVTGLPRLVSTVYVA
jgi:hypothetical protein